MSSFDKFLIKFVESFSGKNPMIFSVLDNIFSMRIIGNKTHGDLAEIALTEYINQFIGGYSAKYTGKEKFRAKAKLQALSCKARFQELTSVCRMTKATPAAG